MKWRVPPPEQEYPAVPTGLKWILAQRLWDEDGSIGHPEKTLITLGSPNFEFLQGVYAAAGDEDVKDHTLLLLRTIQQHGCVEVWI